MALSDDRVLCHGFIFRGIVINHTVFELRRLRAPADEDGVLAWTFVWEGLLGLKFEVVLREEGEIMGCLMAKSSSSARLSWRSFVQCLDSLFSRG
eukprot:scaffold215908_cov20-Prasinocladus_malaysianus.AAC.1